MADERKKSGGDWSWLLIVFCFIKIWPLGLLLLFAKLFSDDGAARRASPPPLCSGAERKEPAASRRMQAGRAGAAVKKAAKAPAVKKSNARLLEAAGAALAVVGLLMAGGAGGYLPELAQGLAFLLGGAAMVYSGLSMDKSLRRYARYLSVMGGREAMPVEELSRTLGYPESRVERDLQRMIDKGYFGGEAYLNVELGYLFRSGQIGAAWKQRQEETARPSSSAPKETEEGYSGILRNIRRANDRIADPVLSAKIDRLEEITARIFRAVEEDPRKREMIGTFLNYYLPTTQKLLDSYAEFESAGIEGENLRQAKERIESTMDAVVRGFEYQLDKLYQADAMDVDSDIRVMEHMLRQDTATAEDDFGLGGAAARRRDET